MRQNLTCEPIGKTHSNKHGLTWHIEIKHENKNFPCDQCIAMQCGKLIKQYRILVQHYNVGHQDVLFNCDICGKKFKEEGNLQRQWA